MRFLLLTLLACPAMLFAEPPPPSADVPPVASHEVERRGNMVQELGTIQAGETDIIADALAPPEDDSHKWFVTLVVQKNCPPCERLKADLLSKPEFKAWIDVESPKDSQVHYQARDVDDQSQVHWITPVRARLDAGGYPAIIIQPPASGEFGKGDTVVGIVHGYDGNPKALIAKLRQKVANYVATLHRKGLISSVGDNSIRGAHAVGPTIGASPPFVTPDSKHDPFVPNGPHDWPPAVPLTFEQISKIVPDATPEFILQELSKRVVDPETVKLHWDEYEAELDENFQPAQAIDLNGVLVLVIVVIIAVAIVLGLKYQQSAKSPARTSRSRKTTVSRK